MGDFLSLTASGLISLPCISGIDANNPSQNSCQVNINKWNFFLPHQDSSNVLLSAESLDRKGIFILLPMQKRGRGNPDVLQ